MTNAGSLLDVYESLARRCADLGVSLWCVAPDGTALCRPSEWPEQHAVGAGELAGRIVRMPAGLCDRTFVKVEGGIYAMRKAAWRGAEAPIYVWIAWRPDEATAVARMLDMSDEEGTRLACGVLSVGESDAARLTRAVCALVDDVTAATQNEVALAQFAERLAQAHEEVNVLFRMTGLLKGGHEARQSLGAMCEQMREMLGFGWVAVRFSADAGQTSGLAGARVLSGEPQCPVRRLDELLVESLRRGGEPSGNSGSSALVTPPVLVPESSELARASGCEVIAQPVLHDGRLIGIVAAGGKGVTDPDVTSSEIRFLKAAAELIGVYHENVARFGEQRNMFLGTLRALTAAIDAKDPYTRGHSDRVALLAGQIADALGLGQAAVEQFRVAGLVHDVGKIGVPEAILCKCGRLDEAEFAAIKRHPEIGHGILKAIPGLADVLPGVLHHHERWDGRGYPHGLAGEAIPLVARVLALADTFDAMSSDRSYRRRLSREQVLAEIGRCAGTQFDPGLVGRFTGLAFDAFDAMLAAPTLAAA